MDGKSLTPQELKLQQLKEILPEAFAEGKVDWEKLKATLGEDINFANERYVLNWAGKSEAFKVLQAPTSKTLVPDKKESVNFDETEHIFIEGENLEVLKVLQKSYFGKVKMIYIDPPYNTGKDSFIYPDKFSETKAAYEKRVGDKDEEGYLTKDSIKFPSFGGVPKAGWSKNSKENGQYHSNWLNMMYPRLFLAKNLLKQDGVIFISIDDNEVHNLRMMMNEVFGEENFIGCFIWNKKNVVQNDAKHLSINHEHILVFGKSYEDVTFNLLPRNEEQLARYKNPDNDPRGKWTSVALQAKSGSGTYEITFKNGTSWKPVKGTYPRLSKDSLLRAYDEGRLWFGKDGSNVPRLKKYLSEVKDGVISSSLLLNNDVGSTQKSKEGLKKLMEGNYFDTPKPLGLLKKFIKLASGENDIIFDFFAGSATTAHAVMQLNAEDGGNRKCISVQLPELTDEKSEAHKAGYKTIADIAKERIRRAGKKINEELRIKNEGVENKIKKLEGELPTEENKAEIEKLKSQIEKLKSQELGFKVLKLSNSNFKQWQQIKGNDAEALEEQMKLFVDPVAENATTENMVYELLLKSGKDLNSKLEYKENYYCVNGNELIFMLEKATQEIVDAIIKENPQKVVALDRLFKGNDQLKTNTSLQMKDAEIEFKTI